jgi:hypothetical protein
MSDSKVQCMVYESGAAIAKRKEAALKKALDYYYATPLWPMDDIAEQCRVVVNWDGEEIFYMGDVELVSFMPPTTLIEIDDDLDDGTVSCKFHQLIKELYSDV